MKLTTAVIAILPLVAYSEDAVQPGSALFKELGQAAKNPKSLEEYREILKNWKPFDQHVEETDTFEDLEDFAVEEKHAAALRRLSKSSQSSKSSKSSKSYSESHSEDSYHEPYKGKGGESYKGKGKGKGHCKFQDLFATCSMLA